MMDKTVCKALVWQLLTVLGVLTGKGTTGRLAYHDPLCAWFEQSGNL